MVSRRTSAVFTFVRGLRSLSLVAILSLAGAAASPGAREGGESLSAADAAAIRAVIEAYRASWLRGDAAGVLATFTPDAVLLPAHGAPWVVGAAAITAYWWPKGAPPTTITKLDIAIESLEGSYGTAYLYGHDDVAWTAVENGVAETHGHPGTYLNVMKRSADGSWKIARHMWDDGAP